MIAASLAAILPPLDRYQKAGQGRALATVAIRGVGRRFRRGSSAGHQRNYNFGL